MKESEIRIELTGRESQMLHEILESYLSDLETEIKGAGSEEWREYLKEKEGFINELLTRLPAFGRIS